MKYGLWYRLMTPVVRFFDWNTNRLIRQRAPALIINAAVRTELRAVKLRSYFQVRRAARLERDK